MHTIVERQTIVCYIWIFFNRQGEVFYHHK
jgi:hypothetical protein